MEHPTPSIEIFDEIKKAAITIWKTKSNAYGYADEKIDKINSISNCKDNAMVFYRTFDCMNQEKMNHLLSDEALNYIYDNL